MNNSQDNLFDIKENLINHGSWNGELSFWGVATFYRKSGGGNQPFKWCSPRSCGRGDGNVYNRLLAKDYHSCFFYDSFANSPTSNEGVHLNRNNSLFGSQKHLVWAVVHYFPNLVCLTKPRRE